MKGINKREFSIELSLLDNKVIKEIVRSNMRNNFQKRTYDSWQEIDTKTLFRGLLIVKENISTIDPEVEDFALTGNLLIDLYEISEELERRLLLT